MYIGNCAVYVYVLILRYIGNCAVYAYVLILQYIGNCGVHTLHVCRHLRLEGYMGICNAEER